MRSARESSTSSWGDDTDTHVYRIVAWSEQIRHGDLSLLLTNTSNGIVVPTFVFYSVVPYVVPVALNLFGVPAIVAFKFVSAFMFAVIWESVPVII